MGEQSDLPNRPTLRRRRFAGRIEDPATRLRDELPTVPAIEPDNPGDPAVDEELKRRCEVILEQVAEINGILGRGALPGDYSDDCQDRLVVINRYTEEIRESVAGGINQPGSMSAWLLRFKRQGRSLSSTPRKAH